MHVGRSDFPSGWGKSVQNHNHRRLKPMPMLFHKSHTCRCMALYLSLTCSHTSSIVCALFLLSIRRLSYDSVIYITVCHTQCPSMYIEIIRMEFCGALVVTRLHQWCCCCESKINCVVQWNTSFLHPNSVVVFKASRRKHISHIIYNLFLRFSLYFLYKYTFNLIHTLACDTYAKNKWNQITKIYLLNNADKKRN